jgi:carbonic anhydrase/acetyltransferase-like protein (isoleucine patch superfamily)
MSEYCLNISGNIELGDYSSINNYMSLISDNDSLIIDINSKNQKGY